MMARLCVGMWYYSVEGVVAAPVLGLLWQRHCLPLRTVLGDRIGAIRAKPDLALSTHPDSSVPALSRGTSGTLLLAMARAPVEKRGQDVDRNGHDQR